MSAEYLLAGGNYDVILCERGVRTFSDHSRNTLDLSVIPPAKALSHLPILVDPSHGTGKRDYVPPMALAALAAGADGLLIEVHPDPDHALSDGTCSRSTSTGSSGSSSSSALWPSRSGGPSEAAISALPTSRSKRRSAPGRCW